MNSSRRSIRNGLLKFFIPKTIIRMVSDVVQLKSLCEGGRSVTYG